MQVFIEYVLNKLDIPYVCKEDYIITHNPFVEDKVKSCQIFYDTGFMHIYNGVIDGKTKFSPKEYSIRLGFQDEYVEYMLHKNDVPVYKYNKYRLLLQNIALNEYVNYKELNELKKELSFLYMTQAEILNVSNPKVYEVKKKYVTKTNRTKSTVLEVDITKEESDKINNYLANRKIPITEVVYPTTISINNMFRIPAICFKYPNSFKKYRLIDSKMRYISAGTYETLYEFRINKTKTAIITEGEIETISLRMVVDYDLFALHNVNSVMIKNDLNCYDNIIVFLDYDKFEEVKEKVEKDIKIHYTKNLKILPKFKSNNKSLDFNSYLINKGENELKKYLQKIVDK